MSVRRRIGVAEIKKHFSEVISEVAINGERFIIEKKGKPVAAVVSLKNLETIESMGKKKGNGLLAAIGVWEDFDELEETIAAIYEERRLSKDRPSERLS
ncbi:MAG: type II toxin-antitoxin system Phd/YefM family antitoxin [Syntrophobacteraceae bacterium]